MIKKINNILKFSSCFLVFILPIFYITNMFFPYASPKTFLFYGLVEIMTALWIYGLIIDSSYQLKKKTFLYFLPLAFFIIWMTIAGILAVNPHLAFWGSFSRGMGLLTLFHCFAFALIICSLIKHNGVSYLYKLMHWFVNGGFILAISLWFGNEGFNAFNFLKDSAGGGLMGNSSLAAAYLMFILAFAFFILVSKNNNINKWWLGIKIAVILFSPIFINIYGIFTGHGLLGETQHISRGAALGLIIAFCFTIVFYFSLSKKKILRLLGIIGIVLGIAIFSIGWMQLIKPNTVLHQSFSKVATGGNRFIFWDIATKSMNQHPFFGYGPENFMIALQNNFDPKLSTAQYGLEGWSDRAHNIYYDTGVSGGYPAIGFLLLFIFSILYALYKLSRLEILTNIQIAILGGLIIGYFFQDLFVFDTLYSFMALFVLAGIIFVLNEGMVKEKYVKISISPYFKNILTCILILSVSISLYYFVIGPVRKSMTYYTVMAMPLDVRSNHFSDLLRGSSVGDDYDTSEMAYNIYVAYNADPVKIKNNKESLPYVNKDLTSLLQYLEVVNKKNTTDTRLKINMISLYNILYYFSDKPYDPILEKHLLDIQEQSRQLAPTSPAVFEAKAQIYEWAQDLKNVEKSYQEAITLDPTLPTPYQFLLRVAKAVGDQKTYNETLVQAQMNIQGFKFEGN